MAASVPAGVKSYSQMTTRTKVLVMAGTLLGLFTAAMDQTIVSTSLPRIVANLGGLGLFPWVFTSFMLTSTTTIPIVGKLTDLFGRKPFYIAGVAILLLGSVLSGSSQTMEQLIAFRAVQGLGAGMIFGIAFAIVGDVFPPAQRGKWLGLMAGVFAAASVIGPLIGGTLTDHVNWRWVFYINLPLGTVALLVLFFGMPSLRPLTRPKLDYRGIVLLVATVVPLLLAFSWAGSRYAWTSPQIIGMFTWAAAALAMFGYAEARAEEPLLPIGLFRSRIFLVSAVVTFITGIAMFGALSYIPLFVQGVIGSSATNSGLVTMPMMIAFAISSAITGQIMSRFGRYRILGVVGLAVMTAGMFLLSQMDANATNFIAIRNMVVMGIGLGMSLPLFMLAVQNEVPHRVMGIATSTMQFLRSVGGTMGVAIMGSLINSTLAAELVANTPVQVRETAPPALLDELRNPQFLLSPQKLGAVRDAFEQLGPQGSQLFEVSIAAVRTSLATAISDAFLLAAIVALAAVAVGVFLKEVPLRRVHNMEGEPSPAAVPSPPPVSPASEAVGLVAGGSTGPGGRRPLAYAAVGAGLAFVLGLLAFIVRRNGG
ncbi:MAG: MFS transporter [Chloroflexi bacterium]|nr:MFS transporter [Chloroflexota bacterium]